MEDTRRVLQASKYMDFGAFTVTDLKEWERFVRRDGGEGVNVEGADDLSKMWSSEAGQSNA